MGLAMNSREEGGEALFTHPASVGVKADRHPAHSLWVRLAAQTRQQDPFCCTPHWQLPFHDAFSPNRRLLIRSSSDSLIAFAEKIFSPANVYLTPIEPKWFFGNPLLGRYAIDLLSDTICDVEAHYPLGFPKIVVSGLAPCGAVLRQLQKRLDSRFVFQRHSFDVQCAASLAGGLDGFLSRRSANHRRKLKKETVRAQRQGVCFERRLPATDEEADQVYARMIAVELRSWKGIHDCGMIGGAVEDFYRLMLRMLARSKDARVIFARHEGRDIGFIFGGMAANIYRGQQFSFDNEWAAYSIGNLMQLEQIAWLCEEGASRYDMGPLLGYRMGYKEHWTEKRYRIESWVLKKR
jgi:hypothetical protein